MATPKTGKSVQQKIVATSADIYIRSLEIGVDVDAVDATAANANYKTSIQGLPSWTVDGTYVADFGSGQIDDVLFKTILSGAQNVQVLPAGGVNASGDNPMFRGNAMIKSWKLSIPHDGLIVENASWNGDGTLNRYTSGAY